MSTLNQKMDFLCESATSLHHYGVPAHRLESVIQKLGSRLDIEEVQVSSIPTALQLYTRIGDETANRLIRVRPGEVDIGKLQDADLIIEQIAQHQISLLEGKKQLIALKERPKPFPYALEVMAYGLTSAAVAMVLLTSWISVAATAVVGGLTGALFFGVRGSERFKPLSEVIAGFTASLTAAVLGHLVGGLDYTSIVLAALIVPIPGLSLTVALMDLATENLMAGTARLMGSLMTLLKLFFGFFIGKSLADVFFVVNVGPSLSAVPQWSLVAALLVATLCFIILFRMKPREYPWVLLACCLSFGTHRVVLSYSDPMVASFLAAVVVAIVANTFARLKNRPASTLMLPGLILLVPGSIGYRSLMSMNQKDVIVGLDLAFQTIFIGLLLVGGILLGNLLISPRRDL